MKQRIYLPKSIEHNSFEGLYIDPNLPVHIKLDTCGGNVAAAVQLIDMLLRCKAPVKGYVSKYCCSAGTIIASVCDEVYVKEGAEMLFHMVRDLPSSYTREQMMNASLDEYIVLSQANITNEEVDVKQGMTNMHNYLDYIGYYNYLIDEEIDDFLIEGLDVVKHSCKLDGLHNIEVVR